MPNMHLLKMKSILILTLLTGNKKEGRTKDFQIYVFYPQKDLGISKSLLKQMATS